MCAVQKKTSSKNEIKGWVFEKNAENQIQFLVFEVFSATSLFLKSFQTTVTLLNRGLEEQK